VQLQTVGVGYLKKGPKGREQVLRRTAVKQQVVEPLQYDVPERKAKMLDGALKVRSGISLTMQDTGGGEYPIWSNKTLTFLGRIL
jgi:hypothetical protein